MVEMKVTIEDQVDSHIHGDILEVEGGSMVCNHG